MKQPERIQPGPGQESAWDYPRPPRVEVTGAHIQVIFNGVVVADTTKAYRVLETSHPPVYYLPPEGIQMAYLQPAAGSSYCEWKGQARYYTMVVGDLKVVKAAWVYDQPTSPFAQIGGYLAFYAGLMDACTVNGERVTPQPGDFYGGWITKDVVGPFKGEPGTMWW